MINKDCTFGFLVGLSIGIAGALLWAPMSGVQTRQLIKDTANQGTDYLREQGTALKTQAAELVDTPRKAGQVVKERLTEAVNAGRQAYQDARSTPAGA